MKAAFVVAVAAVAGYNIYTNLKSNTMSDMMLANVEALASGEINQMCPNGCVSDGDGCTCNGTDHPTWAEYDWGN